MKPGNLDGLLNMAKCLVAWLRLSQFAPVIEASDSRVPFLTSTAHRELRRARKKARGRLRLGPGMKAGLRRVAVAQRIS